MAKWLKPRPLFATIAAIILMISGLSGARAQAEATEFYKGKQIRLIVGSEAGGGYDLYARLLARHFSRFVRGNPQIVVFNQAGAGSIVALNSVYVTQPQDGTVLGEVQGGAPFEQIFGHIGPQFEASKIQWIGSLSSDIGLGVTYRSRVKTFEDLMRYESIWPTSGANLTQQFPSMLMHMFGAKIKQVAGYRSQVEAYGAMERGEVDSIASLWESISRRYPDWLTQHKANFLVQFSLSTQPELKDIPMILDLLTADRLKPGYNPSDARAIWRVMLAQLEMARPFYVGPRVSAERVAELRAAFNQMAVDEQFLADARLGKQPISLVKGEAIQKLIAEAAATPPSLLAELTRVTSPEP